MRLLYYSPGQEIGFLRKRKTLLIFTLTALIVFSSLLPAGELTFKDLKTDGSVLGYEELASGDRIRLSDLKPGRYVIEVSDIVGPVAFRTRDFEYLAERIPYRLGLWYKGLRFPPGSHELSITSKNGDSLNLTLQVDKPFDPYDLLWEGQRPETGRRSTNWPMHEISTPPDPLPNGLDGGDVNGNGFLDYVTNYEHSGRIRIALHPGLAGVQKPWPTIIVGRVRNAESVAMADFDGDGYPDVVVAHGVEDDESISGVSLIWGPAPERVMEESAWEASADIPGSLNGGQYTYVRARDINGDRRPDIIVGGRRNGRASRGDRPYSPDDIYAGLRWFEAPADPALRRDVTQWKMHFIDRSVKGSYGFQFGDIDGDGDEDIAMTNSDWDTREKDRMIMWYENPGNGSEEQKELWPRNIVYEGPEFYMKPQIALGDLDGDGEVDILVQPNTESNIYWFRNLGTNPVRWKRIAIQKDRTAQWRSRPTKLVDLDGDGRMDIVGALIHADGRLPPDKASVFWMRYSGDDPATAKWITEVIKWSDGYIGRGKWVGEKWDQMTFEDVDRDGDLDIVANVEEYHERHHKSGGDLFLGVVWFENTLSSIQKH